MPHRRDEWAATAEPSEEEQALLRRYVDAHKRGDVDAVAALLADDVRLTTYSQRNAQISVTNPGICGCLFGGNGLVTAMTRVMRTCRGVVTGAPRPEHRSAGSSSLRFR